MASSSVRRLTLPALLVALSLLGSFLRLGLFSIAFDSAAGFLAALVLGPVQGALVLALGHLLVALGTGFPLTPLFHLAVATAMALVGLLGGGVAGRWGLTAGAVALVVGNGLLAPLLLALLPNPFGLALFTVMALPLTLGAAANAAVALLLAGSLRRLGVIR
jgi:uncharacterized membrane protein